MSESGNLPGNPRTTKPPWVILGLVILIGLLTLWPNPSQARLSAGTPFLCFPCGDSGTADVVRNILFFVPLGLAMGLRRVRIGTAFLVSLSLTVVVEFLQYAVVPGRDAAMADIVANTMGGTIGAILGRLGPGLLFLSPRIAAFVTVVWATVGVLAIGLMGWSLQGSFPRGTWYGQWAPFGNEPEWFTGDIIEVTLGHRRLPHWRLADSEARRREMMEDTVRLRARVVSMLPPPERLNIVAVARSMEKLVSLTQRERDLRFALRTKAALLSLHTPMFEVQDVMPPLAGDTMIVEGTYWRGHSTVNGQVLELSALDGWSLFLPVPLGTAAVTFVTIAYLLALFAPIGWYGGQVPSSAWAAAPVLVLLADAVMTARLGSTPYPASWEVAVATLAALAGRIAVAAVEQRRGEMDEG